MVAAQCQAPPGDSASSRMYPQLVAVWGRAGDGDMGTWAQGHRDTGTKTPAAPAHTCLMCSALSHIADCTKSARRSKERPWLQHWQTACGQRGTAGEPLSASSLQPPTAPLLQATKPTASLSGWVWKCFLQIWLLKDIWPELFTDQKQLMSLLLTYSA